MRGHVKYVLAGVLVSLCLIGSGGAARAGCVPNTTSAAGCDGAHPGDAYCSCVGYACDAASLGQTTMDGDKKHLAACLLNETGSAYEWKAMDSGGNGVKVIGTGILRVTTPSYATLYQCFDTTGVARCGITPGAMSDINVDAASKSVYCPLDPSYPTNRQYPMDYFTYNSFETKVYCLSYE